VGGRHHEGDAAEGDGVKQRAKDEGGRPQEGRTIVRTIVEMARWGFGLFAILGLDGCALFIAFALGALQSSGWISIQPERQRERMVAYGA
jgi:hypothetical protein